MIENTLLLSTAYLPSIEYYVAILRHKKVVIEQYETFPKQTFRNRCLIYSANGVLPLSIPVNKSAGNNTKTSEITIKYHNDNWVLKHWRAIESAYNSSPFFLYYKDGLQYIFAKKHNRLIDFNTELLHFTLSKLHISVDVQYSTDFKPIEQNDIHDLRYAFSPKHHQTKIEFASYYQVFDTKWDFIPNLSILDLLFNTGTEAKSYLEKYA